MIYISSSTQMMTNAQWSKVKKHGKKLKNKYDALQEGL